MGKFRGTIFQRGVVWIQGFKVGMDLGYLSNSIKDSVSKVQGGMRGQGDMKLDKGWSLWGFVGYGEGFRFYFKYNRQLFEDFR